MATLTVTQVNQLAANLLDQDPVLSRLEVEGELSGVRRYPSGHIYFTVKDDKSGISCVMFRSAAGSLSFEPKDGDKVLLSCKAGIYERDGRFQLYVSRMSMSGEGDLYKQFLQLKADLEKKGYFAADHKKEIPYLPHRIGVVTSSAGAVIRDIINVSHRRYPGFHLTLYPCAVQGEGAGLDLAKGIAAFNRLANVNVIIVGRGGGSLEDLWCFNDPVLAEAIYQSEIPVISAVGHETDFTIADFVADLRAPTPSAAAELCWPKKVDLLENNDRLRHRLNQAINRKINQEQRYLDQLSNRPVMARPIDKVKAKRSQLDLLDRQLQLRLVERSRILEAKNQTLKSQLSHLINQANHQARQAGDLLGHRLAHVLEAYTVGYRDKLSNLDQLLASLSPYAILKRGYSIAETVDGRKVLAKASQARQEQEFFLRWQDGELLVKNMEQGEA